MTDKIDTSNEAVERVRKFVDWPHTSPSALVLDSPLVQITAADLAALLAERDAELARAEKAEGALQAMVKDGRAMLREIYARDERMSPELKAIHDRLACAALRQNEGEE